MFAVIGEHITICKLLLRNGANVNAACCFTNSPLCYAIYRWNTTIVALLMENGAKFFNLSTTLDDLSSLELSPPIGQIYTVWHEYANGHCHIFKMFMDHSDES